VGEPVTAAPPGAGARSPAATARIAVTVVFVIHGVLFASWTAHVPQVKAALHLTDGQLGLALLGAPVGSVSAMLVTGALLARLSSRAVVRVTVVGYSVAGVLVGLVRSLPELFVALALWGMFQGSLDVSMNTHAVAVEKALGRPIMGALHGGWSIGALSGAGVGVLAVAVGIPLSAQLAVLGAVAVAVACWPATRLLRDVPSRADQHIRRRPTPALAVLGAIAFAGLLCEGGTADWAAVYLRDALHARPAVAGLGYAAFALAMVSIRLLGARLLRRVRPRPLICALAAVPTVGMATALAVGNPVLSIIAFGLLGMGLASLIPMLFTAASNQPNIVPGNAVAAMASIGWAGFLLGPPLIGFLAGHLSLPVALAAFPVLTGFITITAWCTPALDRARATGQ
jgi:MFS family permease